MRIAIQMDPIEDIDIDADSTFALALEAQRRGYGVFVYQPDTLVYDEGRVLASGAWVQVRNDKRNHVVVDRLARTDLAQVDVVLLRQDPPFDMRYLTTTYLLDRLAPHTLVVNNPTWVRNWPEKLMVLDFPDLTPPTVIARDLETLRRFRARHGDIVLKPIYGNGGEGIFRLHGRDENFNAALELSAAHYPGPMIAQKFLPQVQAGDKRILLVDGEPIGAINRLPAPGETRSNLHVGGRPEPTRLNDRDRAICAAIGPRLRDRGQIFVGIDVIGDFLTEINVTSPTGLQELARFDAIMGAALVWDAIEARLSGARTV